MTFNLNFTNLKNKVSNQDVRLETVEIGLDNLNATLTNHISSNSISHSASTIEVAPISTLASGDVQAAIEEILQKLTDHIQSPIAHEASKIEAEPLVSVNQGNVQAILEGLEQLELTNFNIVQTRIDNLCAKAIAIDSPVGRAFTSTQNAIDVLNFDIVALRDDVDDHETLINQILASLLNADNSTSTLQTTVDNLKNGTTGFSGLVLPLSPPSSPQVGSAYFNPGDNKLYVYNGSAYKSIQLV